MNNTLDRKEIIKLLKSSNKELFYNADEIRKKYKGNEIHLRGLIEFTNICKHNCLYCGLRRDNKNVERYRLTETEIIECAKKAINLGVKTIVLQGGEDDYWNADRLCSLIKELKKNDVALTLSIGERTFEEYKAFKDAGADRYLLRIETTDPILYKKMHPNMSQKNRFECLENLKKLGYETGTGCLVGLPNQTIESLTNDILFFKEINADMVGIGPFIPHPDTPLSNANKNNFELALKVMAIVRLFLPDINIPATTAMETLTPNGRIIALQSGANVVMPNITSLEYRKKYEIYPDKFFINDSIEKTLEEVKTKIQSIGRNISQSKGFRED